MVSRTKKLGWVSIWSLTAYPSIIPLRAFPVLTFQLRQVVALHVTKSSNPRIHSSYLMFFRLRSKLRCTSSCETYLPAIPGLSDVLADTRKRCDCVFGVEFCGQQVSMLRLNRVRILGLQIIAFHDNLCHTAAMRIIIVSTTCYMSRL